MVIADELNYAYLRLLQDMQDNPMAAASETDVRHVKLTDGRDAQISMKINTVQEEWI